jgi:hypothetical protein
MKKRFLLLTAVAAFSFVIFTSEENGPAANGNNRSGAKASLTTCGTVGAGCHGGTSSATAVTITADSAGYTPVTHYVGGQTYTINISGTNTSNLPKFGFQYAVVSGTGATQVQAGTNSGFPTDVTIHTFQGLQFVEHDNPLSISSNNTYTASFQWTAPAAGTGTVTMYCTLNAVNGDGLADAADQSNNTSITLAEESAPSAIPNVLSNMDVKAYPNPAVNNISLQLGNANTGKYTLAIYDMTGRKINASQVDVSSTDYTTTIDTHNWVPGMYEIAIMKDNNQRVLTVVKQ